MRGRTYLTWLLAAAVVAGLGSCGGVVFDDVDLNQALPDDFKNRTLYAKTDIFKYRLSQLTGSILVQEPGSTNYRRVARVLPLGVEPAEVEIEASSSEIYRSVVDRGASAEGSYLAFTASLKANQIAQVLIRDRYLAIVDFNPALHDAIAAWVVDNPKRDPQTKRWFIQAALLASITTDYYVKIEADAKGVIGNTLGAKGGAYNTFRETATDFRISLELLDLDEWAGAPRELPLAQLRVRAGPPGGQTVNFE